jgi:hypothetical protein
MVSSAVTTVAAYLESLPEDRRTAISQVRDVVNANLPAGYEEGMLYGMIGWYIPLSRYPDTYNGQPIGIAALASQKQYMALYLHVVYADPELDTWFRAAYAASGKKLDIGKSCVRFARLDALPLDVVGQAITKVSVEQLIAQYEASRAAAGKPVSARGVRGDRSKPKAKPKTKPTVKKRPTKKPAKKANKRKR